MTLTCNDTSGLIHFFKVAKKRTLSIELKLKIQHIRTKRDIERETKSVK